MIANSLPQFVLDLIAAVPPAGEGVHNWLFRVARVLHPYRSESEIFAILRAATATCGRVVTDTEITDAIRNSKEFAWQSGDYVHPTKAQPKWPALNVELRDKIISEGWGLVDLWEHSPIRWNDDRPHAEELIDWLFPDNPLLCVGLNSYTFRTERREGFRGVLDTLPLIVPSPMSKHQGLTKEGKLSMHSLDNTGPRRFLVVEFDKGTADEHAALLFHLASKAPLVCAVHSGGKSLHGWFYVQGHDEAQLKRFMEYAVSLGADDATWTRSQFVRIPDGERENGKRQTVYFLNLEAMR